MNTKKLMILAGLLAANSLLFAQESAATQKPMVNRRGIGFFSVGVAGVELSGINSRLNAYGYPQFNPVFITIGGGGLAFQNRMVMGGEGHGYLKQEQANANFKTSIDGGYGVFDIGYLIANKPNFRFFPLLGLGFGAMSMGIDTLAVQNFNQILSKPTNGIRLNNSSFMTDISLNAQARIKDAFFHFITFKAGFKYASTRNWQLNDQKIQLGPYGGITGPYMQLQVGF